MANIRIIGPRSSGKTTYLAALAYWQSLKQAGGKAGSFHIQALNRETEMLAEQAENIINAGISLPPTRINPDSGVDELPFYSFRIEPKHWLRKYQPIDLAVRDHPGEIFDRLRDDNLMSMDKDFIDECLTKDVEGCLILLTGWEPKADYDYNHALRRFLEFAEAQNRTQDLRLAIAMSKCERGEIWPGRIDPEEDLFQVHLELTWRLLRSKIPAPNLRFYALSTFGVMNGRTDPRPNRQDELGQTGRNSTLREPGQWHPYGLISPLYWLNTGKEMNTDA